MTKLHAFELDLRGKCWGKSGVPNFETMQTVPPSKSRGVGKAVRGVKHEIMDFLYFYTSSKIV